MRRAFSLFFMVFSPLLLLAQSQHPFTFEDMMKLKRVGEPVASPDGKWILFSVVDVSLEANTKTPHIWIVPTAGGESRAIISEQNADRPRWAPNGKHFAFVSTKEGGSQIWIADFEPASGKVTRTHKLTTVATEADGELWSPDGNNILFVSNVYPECTGTPEQTAACNAKKLDEHQKSKVKALIFDRLLYRHWNTYKEGMRSHIFVMSADACLATDAPVCPAGAARDLTPGDYDSPVFSLGGQDDYAFSPDGQEICYSSNHDPVEAISTNKDLFTVPVNFPADASSAQVLAATKNITADNKAADETPLYSPDGKYIAYRAQARPGYESDRWRLMLYHRQTRASTELTKGFDHWVGTYVWSTDSDS